MREFGTVYGSSQDVRANRLEQRLRPLVPFPHRHAFYHLVVITAGTGWHEIDFRRYNVRPGQVFLMKPGQVHSWQLSTKTQGFVVEFEESALPRKGSEAALLSRILSGIPEHCERSSQSVLALLKLMLQEHDGQGAGFEISLRHYLITLLIELSRLSKSVSQASSSADPVLDRFLLLIEENFHQEHEVEFYAREMSITSKALTMRATRSLGKSARTLIQERVLLEAKRLLAYSELTVAEAAYELGFDDPNYFTRFFRSHVGAAPGAFRAEARRESASASKA